MLRFSLSELLATVLPYVTAVLKLNTAVPIISVQFHLVDFGSNSKSQGVSYVIQPCGIHWCDKRDASSFILVEKMLTTNPIYTPFWASFCCSELWHASLGWLFIRNISTFSPFPQDFILYGRWGWYVCGWKTQSRASMVWVLGGVRGKLFCSCFAYHKKESSENLAKWLQSGQVVSVERFQPCEIPVGE